MAVAKSTCQILVGILTESAPFLFSRHAGRNLLDVIGAIKEILQKFG